MNAAGERYGRDWNDEQKNELTAKFYGYLTPWHRNGEEGLEPLRHVRPRSHISLYL